MIYHIIYDKESGEILHVHLEFDGATGTYVRLEKRELFDSLADFINDPEKADILIPSTSASIELLNMRVNPEGKKLEKIQSKE